MPEANAADILEDVDDFWTWVREKLSGVVAGLAGGDTEAALDLTKVLVTGESAGKQALILF